MAWVAGHGTPVQVVTLCEWLITLAGNYGIRGRSKYPRSPTLAPYEYVCDLPSRQEILPPAALFYGPSGGPAHSLASVEAVPAAGPS